MADAQVRIDFSDGEHTIVAGWTDWPQVREQLCGEHPPRWLLLPSGECINTAQVVSIKPINR